MLFCETGRTLDIGMIVLEGEGSIRPMKQDGDGYVSRKGGANINL
jgi:hypothetical protein